MPRAAGQIDLNKNEAILDAAATVLSERGLAAPIETIARVAGVSKQTIYNHYGCKAELVRALVARRTTAMAATLHVGEGAADPQTALADFAEAMLQPAVNSRNQSLLRVIVLGAHDSHTDLALQVYEAGPSTSQRQLTDFLERLNRDGVIDVDDPEQAAQFFIGMVVGHTQLRQLMRLPSGLAPGAVRPLAEEAAARFMRAYAPAPWPARV